MFHRAFALIVTFLGGMQAQAQDSPVPGCETLVSGDAGLSDCALVTNGVVIAFLYQPAGEGAVLTVTQTDAIEGLTEVAAPLGVKPSGMAPVLHDLNGDGVPELFVPTASAPMGTAFQLWSFGRSGFYRPTDEITVSAPQAFDASGDLLRYTGAEVDGIRVENAYLFDGEILTLVYAVQMDASLGTCSMVTGRSVFNEAVFLADCEARLGATEGDTQ